MQLVSNWDAKGGTAHQRSFERLKHSLPLLVTSEDAKIEPRSSTLYEYDSMVDKHSHHEVLSKIELCSDYSSPGTDAKDTAGASKESGSGYSNSVGLFEMQSSSDSNMEDTENIYMFKLDPGEHGFEQNSDCPCSPRSKMNDDLMYLLQEPEPPNRKSSQKSLIDMAKGSINPPTKPCGGKSIASHG